MRPVDKGTIPLDENGNAVTFSHYTEARPYLIERIGELCSYCEMHLDAGLAVEHIQPKSTVPGKVCDWDNLLLACPNCNANKGKADISASNMGDYLWPDLHNTFLALVYYEDGTVDVNPKMSANIQQRARNLIKLVGLDKTTVNSTASDRRSQNRREAWGKACRAKSALLKCNSTEMKSAIVNMVDAYFSIWLSVFYDDADMCNRLIKKFIGTCTSCFDSNGSPIMRNKVDGC